MPTWAAWQSRQAASSWPFEWIWLVEPTTKKMVNKHSANARSVTAFARAHFLEFGSATLVHPNETLTLPALLGLPGTWDAADSASPSKRLKHSSTVPGGVKGAKRARWPIHPWWLPELCRGARISSEMGGQKRSFVRFSGLLLACVLAIVSTTSSVCPVCGFEVQVVGPHAGVGSTGHSDSGPDCDRAACFCCGFQFLPGSPATLPEMTLLRTSSSPSALPPQSGWSFPLYRPPRA